METIETLKKAIGNTETRLKLVDTTISRLHEEIRQRNQKGLDPLYQKNELWKFEELKRELQHAHQDMNAIMLDLEAGGDGKPKGDTIPKLYGGQRVTGVFEY